MASVFISFEGVEGAGKTEQLSRLADRLRRDGNTVTVTREPGGTRLGVDIRRIVLGHTGPMVHEAEALLYLADRAQHAPYIRDARSRGVVLTDRFADSTVAYQGFGRGLPPNVLAEMSLWACGGLRPDLVVLLDLDPEIGLRRIAGRHAAPDRIETEKLEFHRRVRAGFLTLAHDQILAKFYLLVNADRPADEVADDIYLQVTARLAGAHSDQDVTTAAAASA